MFAVNAIHSSKSNRLWQWIFSITADQNVSGHSQYLTFCSEFCYTPVNVLTSTLKVLTLATHQILKVSSSMPGINFSNLNKIICKNSSIVASWLTRVVGWFCCKFCCNVAELKGSEKCHLDNIGLIIFLALALAPKIILLLLVVVYSLLSR